MLKKYLNLLMSHCMLLKILGEIKSLKWKKPKSNQYTVKKSLKKCYGTNARNKSHMLSLLPSYDSVHVHIRKPHNNQDQVCYFNAPKRV